MQMYTLKFYPVRILNILAQVLFAMVFMYNRMEYRPMAG